jgi:hypothetical protein
MIPEGCQSMIPEGCQSMIPEGAWGFSPMKESEFARAFRHGPLPLFQKLFHNLVLKGHDFTACGKMQTE